MAWFGVNQSLRIAIKIQIPLAQIKWLQASVSAFLHRQEPEPDRLDRRPCAATRALTKVIRPHPSCTLRFFGQSKHARVNQCMLRTMVGYHLIPSLCARPWSSAFDARLSQRKKCVQLRSAHNRETSRMVTHYRVQCLHTLWSWWTKESLGDAVRGLSSESCTPRLDHLNYECQYHDSWTGRKNKYFEHFVRSGRIWDNSPVWVRSAMKEKLSRSASALLWWMPRNDPDTISKSQILLSFSKFNGNKHSEYYSYRRYHEMQQ